MPNNGVTTGTPTKILFGAGVYFHGVDYNEKVAPTAEQIKAAVFGATQEGGTLTITPEFFTPELDGVHVAVKELQRKIGETAQMEVSFAELTADYMQKAVIGLKGETTDKEYDVVTSSAQIGAGHFYSGFGFYGKLMDGRPVIILFKNALCTSGFTSDPKSKTNALFKGTFACQSDLEFGVERLPYAIFIRKADGWKAVDPTAAAAA